MVIMVLPEQPASPSPNLSPPADRLSTTNC